MHCLTALNSSPSIGIYLSDHFVVKTKKVPIFFHFSWKKTESNRSLLVRLIASLVLGWILGCFGYIYNALVLRPKRLRSRLQKRGIRGPSPSFLLGNFAEMKRIQSQVQTQLTSASVKESSNITIAHDWPSYVTPHFNHWINQYGTLFFIFNFLFLLI